MPRLFSTATCALRIFDAATIFMALVILPMFLMARIRCFTVGGAARRRVGGQFVQHSTSIANPPWPNPDPASMPTSTQSQ